MTRDDAAPVWSLRIEMLADVPMFFGEHLADAVARPYAAWQDRVAAAAEGDGMAQFVAEVDGQVVATATGRDEGGGRTYIGAVYIARPHRGGGLLKALMDAIGEWSAAAGRTTLTLTVTSTNHKAQIAYRRIGFTETGVRKPHALSRHLARVEMLRAG